MQRVFFMYARCRLRLPPEVVKMIEDYCYTDTIEASNYVRHYRRSWVTEDKKLASGQRWYKVRRVYGPAVVEMYSYLKKKRKWDLQLGVRISQEYYNPYSYLLQYQRHLELPESERVQLKKARGKQFRLIWNKLIYKYCLFS